MTIPAGQSTDLTLAFTMHQGMGGPHEFVVRVRTNDTATPERQLIVRSDWGP